MKRDIANRDDLVHLLEVFYREATSDPLIGRFFTEVVPIDLRLHIPVIADFWESVLWGKGRYAKNVMAVHQHIDKLSRIEPRHLDRWLSIFQDTVHELHEGPTAELATQRAASIATLMKIKLSSTGLLS